MFFFTSKTACEMRISDWSSDVCSSDLVCVQLPSPFTDHLVDVVSLELLAPAAIHRGTRHHVARPLEDANPRRDDRRQDAAEPALQGKACEIHTRLAPALDHILVAVVVLPDLIQTAIRPNESVPIDFHIHWSLLVRTMTLAQARRRQPLVGIRLVDDGKADRKSTRLNSSH